jgi:hypothetical protein
MFEILAHYYSHGFPTGCGGCPQIWRFSPNQQILQIKLPDLEIFSKSIKFSKSYSQIFSITSKTRCTSAKVSSLGLWSHWPQVNKHPPAHHPRDARYYSVVDERQLSQYLV